MKSISEQQQRIGMEDHGRPQTDYTGTFFSPCQMPRGRPGGRQMSDPRAVIKFQMPHPRD